VRSDRDDRTDSRSLADRLRLLVRPAPALLVLLPPQGGEALRQRAEAVRWAKLDSASRAQQ
jgi:hypothetical protein